MKEKVWLVISTRKVEVWAETREEALELAKNMDSAVWPQETMTAQSL